MPHRLPVIALLAGLAAVVAAAAPATAAPDDQYKPGPDAERKDGVPQGKVTKHHHVSKVFPGTERDYWVYVPAQYDGKSPACLMVFQDGHAYVNEKGDIRVPVVVDNLIHRGEMPVTIGVFINPGNDPVKNPPVQPDGKPKQAWNLKPTNRSFEYDTLSDQYARFLLEEILPAVAKDYKLTDDPGGRAICGMSSGGICAFTVAWERPDQFRKVVSHIGSFTNIRGGHNYPFLIRKTDPKPLRVFLQDGTNDLDNAHGNWFLGNQQMDLAFKYINKQADELKAKNDPKAPKTDARYDVKFVVGEGAHNGKHGGAIFPDTMRWLWRDWKDSKPKAEVP